MSFRRTISGLANLHIFHRVDAVVYCEGGEQLSVAAAIAGSGDHSTLDCAFWKRIASFLGCGRRYHFKSVGSKPTLISIAGDVARNAITTVRICFDRDFDWHCQRQRPDNFVAYTFGYSWENDVTAEPVLETLFFRLLVRDQESEKLFQTLSDELKRFRRDVRPWCETEITLSKKNRSLVFNRDKPLAVIDMSSKTPAFVSERARAALRGCGYKRRPRSLTRIPEDEALRHCWGKMVSRFVYHLTIKIVGSVDPQFRLTYEAFMRLLASEVVEKMNTGDLKEMRDHYRSYAAVFA